MAVRQIKAVGGLSTDPSSLDRPEALWFADNVSLHREGVIQPRPGFGDDSNIAARTTAYRPGAMIAFDDDVIVWSTDGATYRLEQASADAQYTGDVSPFDREVRGTPCFMQSRRSLYLTSFGGIKKLASADASALSTAGVRTDYAEIIPTLTTIGASAENSAIAATSAVAYRYCWVSTDVNGYIRRSAPSERFVVRSGFASAVIVDFARVYLPSGIAAGDHLEIYRTESSSPETSTPGTEYFLTIDYTVTANDVDFGYIAAGTLRDTTPDARTGATLYTSPSQGGIGQSNETPPCALVMTEWADVAWYGNTQSRRTLELKVENVFMVSDGAYDRTGLHWGLLQADLTLGSTTLLNLSSTSGSNIAAAGLRVGQYVWDVTKESPLQTGGKIPAQTKITAVSSFVTITNNGALPDDTLTLWGETFTWKSSPSLSTEIQVGADANASAANLVTKLNGWNWVEPVTVVASASTNVVTITEAAGNGVRLAITGTGQAISYSATMSAGALDTIGTYLIEVGDYIVVNGVEFYASSPGSVIGWQDVSLTGDPQYRTFFAIDSASTQASAINFVTAGIARAISAYTVTVDPSFGIVSYRDEENAFGEALPDGVVTLLRTTPDQGDFAFESPLRPEAFRPYGTPLRSTVSTRARHRLYWSKPEEPEAVPLLNFTDIGRADRDILALVPLNTAMLVFKEDGIWVITGSAPDAWTLTELDRTLHLVSSPCVCAIGDVCYAWTDSGVAAVTQSGSQIISKDIGISLRDLQDDVAGCGDTTRVTPEGADRVLPDGRVRAVTSTACDRKAFWMTAHHRLNYILLGVGLSSADQITTFEYVFHLTTGRWSRWPLGLRCATYDFSTNRMVVSRDIDAWNVVYERTPEIDPKSYHDASLLGLAVESIVLDQVNMTKDVFGPYTPVIGDVLVDGTGHAGRIVAIDDGGFEWSFTVDSSALTGTTIDWHQSFTSIVTWQAQKLTGIGARWQEMHVHLAPDHNSTNYSGYVQSYPVSLGGTTEQSGGAVDATVGFPSGGVGKIVRIGLPRNVLRATHFYPLMVVNTAGAYWRVSEVALHGTATSRRVAR